MLVLVLLTALDCSAQAPSPAERFARGKALIDANCGDCQGASQAGLEQGIAEVEAALNQGYPDRVAALRVLAGALNTLELVYLPQDGSARQQTAQRKRAIYEELAQLRPRDPEILYEYAASVRGDQEQIRAFRAVLAVAPNHAPAHFALGMLLLRTGATSEGVEELKRAVETSNRNQAATYGREVEQTLTQLGRAAEAAEVRRLVAQKLQSKQ